LCIRGLFVVLAVFLFVLFQPVFVVASVSSVLTSTRVPFPAADISETVVPTPTGVPIPTRTPRAWTQDIRTEFTSERVSGFVGGFVQIPAVLASLLGSIAVSIVVLFLYGLRRLLRGLS
jgi:hypothetical protein